MLKLIVVILVLLFAQVSAGWAGPPDRPGPKDRCPVCGMFVAPYPEWLAVIVKKDGSQLFFDGCKDMLRYYFNLAGPDLGDIKDLYVTEYYRSQLVSASQVYYVVGSDVYGPMGKELIPIAGQKNAETFMADHNGLHIFSFKQLSVEMLPGD